MKNTIGELNFGSIAISVVIACALAWFVYSRFSFRKEANPADRTVVIERELQQAKDASGRLSRRIEELEHRLPESVQPAVPKGRVRQKAAKGK